MNTVSEESFEKALDKIRELSRKNGNLKSANAELLEVLENNNNLLKTMVYKLVIREDYRATRVADQIRDNYEAIRKARKGEPNE